MNRSELALEVLRLRGLDRLHRKISEEAEQRSRDVQRKARTVASQIETAKKKIEEAYKKKLSQTEIDSLWTSYMTEVEKLRAL